MKKAKRILALMLAALMLTTCFTTVVSADSVVAFSDVENEAIYIEAVKTLNLMSIVNGYPDGTFGPDKNVTRAEFTAMLMRTLGIGGIGSATTDSLPFTDVSVDNSDISWAIPDINTAYDRGIINGYEDKTFRPSANVAYEEAIKMIVCSLGYVMDVDVTPWYTQYVSQAAKLGITTTAGSLGATETPATRACIAQMLYDSLEVPLVENEEITTKTILTDCLGYVKGTGVITSDGITSLTTADLPLRDNEVQIDNGLPTNDPMYEAKTYQTTDTSLKNYLGYGVDYYYKDNGTNIRTLAVCVLKDSAALTLTDDMIEAASSNANQIRYYKTEADSHTTVAAIDTDNVVIYNGKLLGATATASRFHTGLIPQVGSMKLIDSDIDGKYDVIRIEDYKIYYVSSKVSADYSIIDDVTKTGNDKKLILNVDDRSINTTIVNAAGQPIDYNAISSGNIICLATSSNTNGGEVIKKAVVVTETVRGTITGMDGNGTLTINNNQYKVSKAAPWRNGMTTLDTPMLQDTGVYCLDINGDIVAYKKDATTETVSYGYIIGTKDIGSFGESKEMRILTGSGSVIDVVLQDNVRLNGNPVSVDTALSELAISAGVQNKDSNTNLGIHQLIKFTTKSSGGNTVIDKIFTATAASTGSTIENNKLYFYNQFNGATPMVYNATSQRLTNASTGANIGVSSATLLVVPSDRSRITEFKKSSVGTVFKNGGTYYIEAFDVSTTNTPKVIVCYGGNSSTDADSTTPLSVVSQEMERKINDAEGTAMWNMSGYKTIYGNAKSTFTGWVSPISEHTPALGDIFRAGTDEDGYAKVKNQHVVYSPSNNILTYGKHAPEPSGADFYDSEYSVLVGSVVAVDDTSVMILPQKISIGDTGVDISSAMTFEISKFAPAQMLLYDVDTNGKLTVTASSEYQGVLKGLVAYDAVDGLTNPSKVIIYMVHGQIVMCAVLDDAV